jgi:hypothetical protein
MSCAQCRHENRPDASFCHECGYPLLHLWPRADLGPSPTPAHGRPRRPPSRLIEVVGAIGIVVVEGKPGGALGERAAGDRHANRNDPAGGAQCHGPW